VQSSAEIVKDQHQFKLYEDYKKDWLGWSPEISLTI